MVSDATDHHDSSEDLCRRYGFVLVELLPGRVGGSVGVVHVRNDDGEHFVLKETDALHRAGELAVLKAASTSGTTPQFEKELEPGVYIAEWLPGRSLASVPTNESVDATAIGRTLHMFHRVRPPDGLRDTREWLHPDRAAQWRHLPVAMRALGERFAAMLHAYRPRAPVLVHGDLVPTNVLLTADGARFIDPVGFCGLPAWDVAQLAISAEGRGRRGMLPALLEGYGEEVPHIEEMVGWMVLHYLDKNLAASDSPYTQHLQPLAESLVAASDTTAFIERYISSGGSSR